MFRFLSVINVEIDDVMYFCYEFDGDKVLTNKYNVSQMLCINGLEISTFLLKVNHGHHL